MKPLYIFDIDGTIALIDHRRHIVDDANADAEKWRKFYAACDQDLPNTPVIRTMEQLRGAGAEVWFFSGRSDEVRGKTIAWLADNTSFQPNELEEVVMMRREGDFAADDELKRKWFDGMLVEDQRRLVAVFDDRDRVVAMWRSVGVACFQVAPGDF
jgi:hypothetical protein